MCTSCQRRLREVVEEYKAGVYIDSNIAAMRVAAIIDNLAGSNEGFSWLMLMLDNHLPPIRPHQPDEQSERA